MKVLICHDLALLFMTSLFHCQMPKKDKRKKEKVWEYPYSYPCLQQRQCLIYSRPTTRTPPQLVSLNPHQKGMTSPPDCNMPIHFQILVLLLRMTSAHQEITRREKKEKRKHTHKTHPCAKRKGDARAKLLSKKIMLENWAVI